MVTIQSCNVLRACSTATSSKYAGISLVIAVPCTCSPRCTTIVSDSIRHAVAPSCPSLPIPAHTVRILRFRIRPRPRTVESYSGSQRLKLGMNSHFAYTGGSALSASRGLCCEHSGAHLLCRSICSPTSSREKVSAKVYVCSLYNVYLLISSAWQV